MRYVIYGYIAFLVVLSIVTFCLYASDKKKAKSGQWRIPEKVLLLCSFFGGAYGGYTAMLRFRHKTKAEHWYFTAVNILGLIIHTALLIFLFVKFY